MTDVRKALIVGGGIGGLSAAIALRQIEVEVDLVEINPEWSVYGVGIIQPANALRALDAIGVAHRCVEAGFPFEGTRTFDADGTVLLDESRFERLRPDLPAMNGLTRPNFQRILVDAATQAGIDVRLGVTVTSLAQSPGSVTVDFTDGETRVYDLVVGADGIYSKMRQLVFGADIRPTYAGQLVWRCNAPLPEGIDCISEYLRDGGSGGKAGIVPLEPGLCYVHTGQVWPEDTPIPRTGLDHLLREHLASHAGPIGELRDRYINDSDKVVVRPLETILMPAPWFLGRVVLIGDAVHAPTSKLGQGAAMTIEDAVVLGQEIAAKQTVERALTAFMERRYERCKFIVEASMQICRWELGLDRESLDHVGLTVRSMELTAQPL